MQKRIRERKGRVKSNWVTKTERDRKREKLREIINLDKEKVIPLAEQ